MDMSYSKFGINHLTPSSSSSPATNALMFRHARSLSFIEQHEVDCVKAFKRGNHEEASYFLPRIPLPATVRTIYRPEWDHHFVSPREITLLHLAAQNGWEDICEELILKYKCDPKCTDDQNVYTPMHYAIGGKQLGTVELFTINDFYTPQANLTTCTPLHLACIVGADEIVDYLIKQGKDLTCFDHMFNTPLHDAAIRGHAVVVRSLLATNKIDPLCRNIDGDTPLHFACRKGHLDIITIYLLSVVSDLECKNNVGDTPLHDACRQGFYSVIENWIQLRDVGGNITNSLGNTVLHEACAKGHENIVKILLSQANIDIMFTNINGDTPLHISCQKGHLSIVKVLLLQKNVTTMVKNLNGETPLQSIVLPQVKEDLAKLFEDYENET